jgi:hypothetical protein
MISFNPLGDIKASGRLGNAMFQYAFIRSTANRLGVRYYCPNWWGDVIFTLEGQQKENKSTTTNIYSQTNKFGFEENAYNAQDNTNFWGYFQSEKYFNREQVLNWYTFKEEKIKHLPNLTQNIPLEKSVSVHIRLTDYKSFQTGSLHTLINIVITY